MAKLESHPTVQLIRAKKQASAQQSAPSGNTRNGNTRNKEEFTKELRDFFRQAGADDVGFVSIDRPELDDQREHILECFPHTKTLISIVCRMNREPIRRAARSVANLEFHSTGEQVNHVAREVVSWLEQRGIGAINPSMGFPMEINRFPGRIWTVSHKPVAVAAGLGQMGIHRNVIHPKFGNFILLGTVLIDAEVAEEGEPVDFNPCLECKLCVAACPVGAIASDGGFNFSSCFTHNYREFMSGFSDWSENLVTSKSVSDYRSKVTDPESASMWQSLSFGANYKAAYCLSVCPAGEDVISPFLDDRKQFLTDNVKPLQEKEETLYVLPGSDAEEHAQKRFPHKSLKHVGAVLRPTSIRGFIEAMHHVFQPGKSKGLEATYHFHFTGAEPADCTVHIGDQKIEVHDGHVSRCDLKVTADSNSWLKFLRKEVSIVWLLLTLRVRMRGNPKHLLAFGRCFP